MHDLYREALDARPAEIAEAVETVNWAVAQLEPVLQPVGWDYDQIDRDAIAPLSSVYSDAGIAIDKYIVDACGIESASILPDDNEFEFDDSAPSEPRPTQAPDAPPTQLEIDIEVARFERLGLSREHAECMADAYLGVVALGNDDQWFVERLLQCGLTPDVLEQYAELNPAPERGPRTAEEIEQMVQSSERFGMSRSMAECHVEAYLGQVVDGQSPQWAVDLMVGCGITPELLESLGIPVGCPWRPGMCANP